MIVCYFGSYDIKHPRNRVIINGLRQTGVMVHEVNTAFRIKILRIPILALKFLKVRRMVDVIIVGACGQAYVPLAKLLSKVFRKPLIFDAFVSYYRTMIKEEGTVKKKSLKAGLYYIMDKVSCSLAEVILLDTDEHIGYFVEQFNIPRAKFERVLVGADEALFFPSGDGSSGYRKNCTILCASSYYSLHGVQHVLEAAHILRESDGIKFILLGNGMLRPLMERLGEKLKLTNVEFRDWVDPDVYATMVRQADICLGIFGDTGQARDVIPCKVYDALASGKALITGDTPAVRFLLKNGENAILCPIADGGGLASVILLLKGDENLRRKIGQNGYKVFKENCTQRIIGAKVSEVCESLCRNATSHG